eukprot:Nk52_evm1s2570 gene=Nk52_evmTU1s2570
MGIRDTKAFNNFSYVVLLGLTAAFAKTSIDFGRDYKDGKVDTFKNLGAFDKERDFLRENGDLPFLLSNLTGEMIDKVNRIPEWTTRQAYSLMGKIGLGEDFWERYLGGLHARIGGGDPEEEARLRQENRINREKRLALYREFRERERVQEKEEEEE